MPNWTRNELIVQADDPKDLKDFKKKVFTKDEEGKIKFDFEKIIPMPENIFRGNLGNEEREQYGDNNWYDWDTPRPIIKKLKKKFPKLSFWGGYIHEGWEGAGTFNEIQ